MIWVKRKYKYAVLGVSLIIAASIIALVIMGGEYQPEAPYWIPLNPRINNTIVIAFMVAILPVSILEYINNQWLKAVDKYVPRLLMDITESIRSGLALMNALEVAATRDYGPINEPLEAAVVHMKMTADLESSLKMLGERLQRPNAKRMVTILLETNETGGRMLDVLETSIDMFTFLDEYREERDSQVNPYIVLVYVGSLIFLIISWTVVMQFIGPIIEASQDPNVSQAGLLRGVLSTEYYKAILFWASTIQGLFGGLVAGKIIYDRVTGGLIHSVILLILTLSFFNFILM
jgi:flagellar protein FlaJ